MIEAWFGILARKSVRRGSFPTVRQLVDNIHTYINHWNENPSPFGWTKQSADIIKKALRRAR
jgi:putative transposase